MDSLVTRPFLSSLERYLDRASRSEELAVSSPAPIETKPLLSLLEDYLDGKRPRDEAAEPSLTAAAGGSGGENFSVRIEPCRSTSGGAYSIYDPSGEGPSNARSMFDYTPSWGVPSSPPPELTESSSWSQQPSLIPEVIDFLHLGGLESSSSQEGPVEDEAEGDEDGEHVLSPSEVAWESLEASISLLEFSGLDWEQDTVSIGSSDSDWLAELESHTDALLGDLHDLLEIPESPPAKRRKVDPDSLKKITVRSVEYDDTCTICMEEFDIGGEARALQCSHKYHEACILEWLERKGTCPMCRAKVP